MSEAYKQRQGLGWGAVNGLAWHILNGCSAQNDWKGWLRPDCEGTGIPDKDIQIYYGNYDCGTQKFFEWTTEIAEPVNWCAWTMATAVGPIFITPNMCAPVSLACVRKSFDISPGQYFPCTPQKGKLKVLWAFPRNALSRGREPWLLPNKTGLLWAESVLPTFNWYQCEKQIFHLSNDQTHKITQECTVCWFEQHRRLLQAVRKDRPIYVHW